MSPPELMRVPIADDEGPARQRLRDLLQGAAVTTELRDATDGRMAIQMIAEWRPDLVLLDVQMPELTGMEVIQAIGAEHMPLTIFVTAWDQHAVSAFQSNALDYLLKPYSDARFYAALARARQALDDRQLREFGANIGRMLAVHQQPATTWLERVVVKSTRTTQLVRVRDVDWIESAGVHVILHVQGTEVLHRIALAELVGQLDPTRFVRVHRSLIVNIDSIARLDVLSHGEFEVLMQDGARRKVSRTYRTALERCLGQAL